MDTYHAWFELKKAAVYSAIEGVQFALYRDFPDPGRVTTP